MDLFDVTTGVADGIADVKEGISNTVGEVKEGISNTVNGVKETASEKVAEVKENINTAVDNTKEKVGEIKENVSTGVGAARTGVASVVSATNEFFKLDKNELAQRINEIKVCNDNIYDEITSFKSEMNALNERGFFKTTSTEKTFEKFQVSYNYASTLHETIISYVDMLSTKVLASTESVDSFLATKAASFEDLTW